MTKLIKAAGEYEGDAVVLAAPGARAANGAGPAVPSGSAHTVRATLDVTAAGGATPSLTVALETSEDGVNWRQLATYTAATGTGQQRRSAAGLDRFVRASWTLAGNFTFAVSGELVG